MGCLFNCFKNCSEHYEKEKQKEKKYLIRIKDGLKNSIDDINETIKPIKEWEELLNLNLKEEFIEETEELNQKNDLTKSKGISLQTTLNREKPYTDFYSFWSYICGIISNSKCCLIFCFIFGVFFCIIQLIGVQLGIICLNALFKEIVDEFKLLADDNYKKEYNFYEKIEIASYKSIPEIDVGMFWSFVGITFLKNFGFLWSNIFQVISLISFILLFLLFDFHIDDKLLINYTRMELTVLIISYIILSISIGASSAFALKEFSDLYFSFYENLIDLNKNLNLAYWLVRFILFCIKCKKNKNNKDKGEDSEKDKSSILEIFEENDEEKKENRKHLKQLFFYTFSIISSFLIIIINRQIFIHFKSRTSKWILKLIIIVYAATFGLNLIFYFFYSFPLINKKIKKKIKKEKPKISREKKENYIGINDNSQETINKYIQKESEISGLKNEVQINQDQLNKNEKDEIKENKIISNSSNNSELTEVKKIETSFKVCTCIGYMFFQKKIGDKSACIFYYYDSCCSWFWLKIKKPQIFGSFFIEFIIQLNSIGFNAVYSEKLLKEYSFSKYLKFVAYFIIIFFVMNMYLLIPRSFLLNKCKEEYKKLILFFKYFGMLIVLLIVYSLGNLISTIVYLAKDMPWGDRWEQNIIGEIQLFKFIDLQMLSVYDFFDDNDFLNTSVVFTFERFLWMIIEIFLDTSSNKIKNLIIIQLAFSSVLSIISIISVINIITYIKYINI